MKRIPKGFQLGPHRISVHIVSEEEMREVCIEKEETDTKVNDHPPVGLTCYNDHEIYVQRVSKHVSKGLQMHAFWHEYFHMLFWCVGRERLSRDETLVDVLGAMQLQALQTAEH